MKTIAELYDMTGQVAIVTGGAEGLGLAIVDRLSEAGASVVINDFFDTTIERTIEKLQRQGPRNLVAASGDVSLRGTAEKMLSTALNEFGRVDVLVNNAGIFPSMPFLEMTEEHWNRVLAVNLTGPMVGSQVIARHMVRRGEG